MDATSQGDPAPQLTREDIDRRHAAMVAAEPDWTSRSSVLAAALGAALVQVRPGYDASALQATLDDFDRDREHWLAAADDYFRAVGGPIEELLPLEEDQHVAPS